MVGKFDISKNYSIQEVGEMAKRSALSKPSPKGSQRKPAKKRLDTLNIGHKPFYESTEHSFQLYMGDCLEVLPKISEGSIDMVFADPPYFLSNDGITCHAGRMVSVNKGKWDKSPGVGEMHEFNLRWLEACQRVLKKDGTIWVSGTSHVIHSIGFAMQQLGLKILNDIVWYKRNAPPNLSCRYFTHSTEIVLWAAKNKKSRHTFNYPLMKEMNEGKQMRNVWQISAPPKAEKLHGKHPTQKPLELLTRIILASTHKDELVLDPFQGSGSTGIAAIRTEREYIGIDTEKEYLELAKKRFRDETLEVKIPF